ncbi:MAG: TMEM175 family protein [Desulfobacterales bacterium]|nr:TMEM175 family protein [Desulfobacterales bacterium]
MNKANAIQERETRQLKRLGTLVDAVFAIVLVVMVLALPYPSEMQWTGASIWGFLDAHKQGLGLALIGTILVVLYWVQSNALFGNLARTDNRHTILALGQVFFLLLYLYAIGVGIDFPDDPYALALQSAMAGMVGLAAAGSWRYACHKRRLLSDRIHDDEARNLQLAFLAEPVTALITIPFAFTGRLYWDLAWLSYPLVARLLGRWKRGTEDA